MEMIANDQFGAGPSRSSSGGAAGVTAVDFLLDTNVVSFYL
jgi:hypothetical protein